MASPCVVQNCVHIGNHRFPKDIFRKAKWIEAIKYVKPWLIIREHSMICSAHFRHSDFKMPPAYWKENLEHAPKRLKKTAIPSVFPWIKVSPPQNQVSQEQLLSMPLVFNQMQAQATYSQNRTPRIPFVEIQPYFDTHSQTGEAKDPLHLSSDEAESQDFKIKSEINAQDIVEDQLQLLSPVAENQEFELKTQYIENDLVENALHQLHDEVNMETNEAGMHTKSDFKKNAAQTQTENRSIPAQTQTEKQSVLAQTQTEERKIPAQTQTEAHKSGFSVYDYRDDNKSIHFYTGLENFKKLMLVFYTLGRSAYNLTYFYGPPPNKIDSLEQFFLTLIILRRHKTFVEIQMLYKISLRHVYSIFITWIRFMALQWKKLDLWIDRENVKAYMPSDFYAKYPRTRCILDATECPIKKPKLPSAQQITFSSYKNRNTIKFIIGITPGGMINYVSPAYGGSATDRQIIERSSILKRFDYNDEIMVDKGLNVQDIFISYGVKVNMPEFFRKGNQITSNTLTSNRKVASKRVHVERVIGMMKTYKILREPMNQTETLLSSDIALVIAMLVNFRSDIVSKNA